MFFVNFQQGKNPRNCADDDHHNIASMGGFVTLAPVSVLVAAQNAPYPNCIKPAQKATRQQVFLTHNSETLAKNAEIYSQLLTNVLFGVSLQKSVEDAGHSLGLNIAQLSKSSAADESVIGSRFSSACYIQDSFPSLLFLAHRYSEDPKEALIANTNVGGENCHRGAALGALLGLSMDATQSWPEEWVSKLHDQTIIKQADDFAELVQAAYIASMNRL
jgi:ADP-ribosylglycohydrolase